MIATRAVADPGGVDEVASHPPPLTCSFVHGTMGVGLASHPLQFSIVTYM